ncbi:TonB-dependent receptor [uncultured Phocaeicola sp.]|uniref:SusC/RagA family TonB-linked outer membrane protein n=1 Tax=uncultured Phocaeicola sp. TaxID=990718 RepID=UPI00258FD552|nr:TonB-dependent receptor [uncultured Phocaeicola sp.]
MEQKCRIKGKLPKLLMLLCMFLCSFTMAFAQKTVKGTVLDETGSSVIGANVLEKGTTNGTITDMDGNFTLKVKNDAVLVVSFIGYKDQTIPVKGKTEFKITLKEDSGLLDEVVVVGYGVQKKVNLTGAVSTVSAEKLESRATTSLSSSLSGLAAGVQVNQGSGKPGSDGASIQMRGLGSFNSSSPMVIVDGSEASMASVNSDDVESISFLKDAASAAIYGSRGANGVILITTKKGKKGQAPKITYTGIVTNSKMSGKAFHFEDNYAEYMEMANRWSTNRDYKAGTKYTQAAIDEWREGLKKAASNPNGIDNPYGVPNFLAYPSTQWVEELFRPYTMHKHNVSITGGSDKTTYLLSFGYMDNPGMLQNTGLKRYEGRVNVETEINKFLSFGTQTYATFENSEPGNTSFTYMFQNTPAMTPEYNGRYGVAVDGSSTSNLLADVLARGGSYNDTRLNTTWYARLKPFKGLTIEGRFNYQTTFNESETYSRTIDKENFRTGDFYAGTSSDQATTYRATTRYQNRTQVGTVSYANKIGDHDFNIMVGTEQYYWTVKGFNATRTGLLDMSLPDFTAATDKMIPTVGGTPMQEYGVISYFGRVNYSYKDRYLVEANFRRDGSSRFGPDHRWGTFPSVSLAWRVLEEPFMEPVKNVFSNLKLRASWGRLGNTTSGYYDWQATYSSNNYSFGGETVKGLKLSKIANPYLHWETGESTNVGLEMAFLNNRLSVEADWYQRTTKGILATPSIFMTMGSVSAPVTNTSNMRNRGIEMNLRWSDKIKDFEYSVGINFAYNNNKVTKYKGKLKQGWEVDENGNRVYVTNRGDVADYGNTIVVEDHIYNEHFLYERHKGNGNVYLADGVTPDPHGGPRDGMIRTKQDLDWVRAMIDYRDADGNRVYNINNQSVGQGKGLWYGEMVYADVNGDGMYGTNDDDRVFTGKSTTPKYTYGINFSAAWKGIDLNMTWAGNAGMYRRIYERGFNDMSDAGWQEGTIVARNARHIYYYCDPELSVTDPNYDPANDPNANIYASYMRIGNTNSAHRANTGELYNASYIKLKTLQIGYTFPQALMRKAYINKLRVFASFENLLTITNFPGVDPEMGGSGFQSYPIPRMISGGLNITF